MTSNSNKRIRIKKAVPPKFMDFLFDWDYKKYINMGGYGSGKSYGIALKIILKLFAEKRKCLVVRQTHTSIRESCFDLFKEILVEMDMIADWNNKVDKTNKVRMLEGIMEFRFPNGSKIIFKGMDDPMKVKSINGVSIVWLEEASEIRYDAYKELIGRLRTPKVSLHFLLSFNPIGYENWTYRQFFKRKDKDNKEIVVLDDELLYDKGTIIKGDTYYIHSTVDDNDFVPVEYKKELDNIKEYDYDLWRIARYGRFGATGIKVLPQIQIAKDAKEFKKKVNEIDLSKHYFGMDFGFEESYNAVVSMAVDEEKKILYIYDEIYVNHLTDVEMARREDMKRFKEKQDKWSNAGIYYNPLVADNEDPKAIKYYSEMGFKIRACRNKFAGSRLSNTRKVKRFSRIIVSPKCKNCIRELKDLTYKVGRNGELIYDEFNIDPHTFSAIWYGLDTQTVADPKNLLRNSRSGM